MNQQSASKMLQVTGILLIIGGAASVLVSFFALIGAMALAGMATSTAGSAGAAAGGILIFAVVVAIIVSVAELVAGILGAANHNKPEKAQPCFVFGIILIVLGVVSIILNISSGSFNIFNVVSSLALPILYTVGAYFVKKNAGAQF